MDAVTDLDRRQAERVAQLKRASAEHAAADGLDKADKPATAGTAPQPAARKGDRWATYNAFVDAMLAQTTEAEVRVWLVLYRDVKPGGLARVGMTDIARRAGITRRGVVKAVNGLKRRRLIVVESRGCINGTPNAYRLLNPGA